MKTNWGKKENKLKKLFWFIWSKYIFCQKSFTLGCFLTDPSTHVSRQENRPPKNHPAHFLARVRTISNPPKIPPGRKPYASKPENKHVFGPLGPRGVRHRQKNWILNFVLRQNIAKLSPEISKHFRKISIFFFTLENFTSRDFHILRISHRERMS